MRCCCCCCCCCQVIHRDLKLENVLLNIYSSKRE
jgi:serine/threonine protein kinase